MRLCAVGATYCALAHALPKAHLPKLFLALRTRRLQLLSALLPVVGMSGKSGGDGFALDAVMDFVGAAFSNSSAEVRGAAVQLTLQVRSGRGWWCTIPGLLAACSTKCMPAACCHTCLECISVRTNICDWLWR